MKRFASLISLCVSLFLGAPVFALNPDRSLDQYKHTIWTADQGVPRGIYAIAQGMDGYLWLGAGSGLYRFDGISFEPIPIPLQPGERKIVDSLFVAKDGTIWGGVAGGLFAYSHGEARRIKIPGGKQDAMEVAQTPDGAIWVQSFSMRTQLLRYANGRWTNYADEFDPRPENGPIDMLVARDGTLWVSTVNAVKWLKPGAKHFTAYPKTFENAGPLSEDPAGHIWVSALDGTWPLTPIGFHGRHYPTQMNSGPSTFFDHDGNLWGINPYRGFYRLRRPNPAGPASSGNEDITTFHAFGNQDGRDDLSMFEDREGNIWVGTINTLERYRDVDIVTEPTLTKVPEHGQTLLQASDGSVYIGDGLGLAQVRPHGNPEHILTQFGEIETVCEGHDGDIWAVAEKHIIRLSRDKKITPYPRLELHLQLQACAVDNAGDLWMTSHEGIYRFHGGKMMPAKLPVENETSIGERAIAADRDGKLMMFASYGSLIRFDYPGVTTVRAGRPDAFREPKTIYPRAHDVLLGGTFGLARWQGNRFSFVLKDRLANIPAVVGIVRSGPNLWLASGTPAFVSEAALNRAFDDPHSPVPVKSFGQDDGLPAGLRPMGNTYLAAGGDGRIWIATQVGTVWLDPAHLMRNTIPPGVTIGSLTADSQVHLDPRQLTLAKGTRSIEIDFAANSLSRPRRNKVLYRLDGFDKDWVDPKMRRNAVYTNLAPGTYRFRVIASNNDGIWNKAGAVVEFTIPPTFIQSIWFKLLLAALVLAIFWVIYIVRLRQMRMRMQAGLDIQLAERERIARELHDTLLQGFAGLMLRVQAQANRLPSDEPVKTGLNDILDRAEDVMVEGRHRVRDLRATSDDLAGSLTDLARELAVDWPTKFDLTVEGETYLLAAYVATEVQTIAIEAVRNAFRHAHARTIKAVITYRPSEMRFQLMDDGSGLPADVAATGNKDGHYGLVGMRERANRVGGSLTISSSPGRGTEIALRVPRTPASPFGARWPTWLPPFLARWMEGRRRKDSRN